MKTIFTILLILFASTAYSATSLNDSHTASQGSGSSLTTSMTTTSGSDYLSVCVGFDYGFSINSVTFNGTSLTEIEESCVTNYPCMALYYLASPYVGTADIVATFNQSVQSSAVMAVTVTGADTGVAPEVSASGTSLTMSVTPLTAGAFIHDCVVGSNNNSIFVNAGDQTTITTATYGSHMQASGYVANASASAYDMDWTAVTIFGPNHGVLVLAPSAGGGSPKKHQIMELF